MNIISIINEEIQRLFEQKIYSISDLAKILERQGFDAETQAILQEILIDAYKDDGDQGVIDQYAKMAGVEIEAVSRGRYMFANLYDPEKHY